MREREKDKKEEQRTVNAEKKTLQSEFPEVSYISLAHVSYLASLCFADLEMDPLGLLIEYE